MQFTDILSCPIETIILALLRCFLWLGPEHWAPLGCLLGPLLAMTHASAPGSLTRCMSRKLTSADVISTVSLYIKCYLDLSMTHQIKSKCQNNWNVWNSVVDIILTNTYSEPITLTTLGARAGTWRAESDRYWRERSEETWVMACIVSQPGVLPLLP